MTEGVTDLSEYEGADPESGESYRASSTSDYAVSVPLVAPSWHTLLQKIGHASEFSSGIHVVSGQHGAGKTTFQSLLLQHPGSTTLKNGFTVSAAERSAEIAARLLQLLGLPSEQEPTVGSAIARLRQYVGVLRREQQRSVLVIDDADLLEDAFLAGLTSVLQGDCDEGFGLFVVMLSKPGLAERLDQLELIDVVVQESELPGLSVSELFELFWGRFAVGDSRDGSELPLEQVEINKIWVDSSGLPGPALSQATELVEQKLSSKGWRIPVVHLVAIALLLLVLTSIFIWQQPGGEASSSSNAEEFRLNHAVSKASEDSSQSIADEEALSSSDGLQEHSGAAPKLNLDTVTSGESQPDSHLSQLPLDEKALASTTPAGGDLNGSGLNEQEAPASVLQESNVVESTDSDFSVPQVKEPVEASRNVGTIVKVSEVAVLERPLEKESKVIDQTVSEKELLALSNRGYVLQLMALTSEKALKRYVAEQSNSDNLKIYRGSRSGKRWFMAVEGFYADRGSALAAIQNLPRAQRRNSPWPKPVSNVQKEIKAFQEQQEAVSGYSDNY